MNELSDAIGHAADRLLEAAETQAHAIQTIRELCEDYIRINGEF